MSENQATVQAAPFEAMTKTEMFQHLRESHDYDPGYVYGSRVTKTELESAHRRLHMSMDANIAEGNAPRGIAHKHDQVIADDAAKAQVEAAKSGDNTPISDKPLSATERKVLSTLVDNDFAALRNEMEQLTADTWQQRQAEVDAEWKDKQEAARKYQVKAREALTRLRTEMQRLRDEARTNGVTFEWYDGYLRDADVSVDGYVQAVKEAKAQHWAELERAKMMLERQRLAAQRKVMLSGVTVEAAGLLNTIPSARSLMLEAQRQDAAKAIGSADNAYDDTLEDCGHPVSALVNHRCGICSHTV